MIDSLKTDFVFLPVLFGRNRIEHIIEPADPDLGNRAGLRYCLEIQVPSFPQSSDFVRLLKMPGSERPPVTRSGASVYEGAFFRIDELLNGALSVIKPDFGQTKMSVLVSLTMPFELRESIENNGALLPGSAVTRPKRWVMRAGLTEEDFAGWGSVFFDQYLSDTRSFLTWQPNGKVIGSGQAEFLYFLLNQAPAPAGLVRRVEVWYEDQTSEVIDRGALSGVGLYQVVCMPVGPKALGLDTLGKRVVSYSVWLSDTNRQRLSEVRTYRIDPKTRKQERLILFANSLGGWDSLRLVGEGSEVLSMTRTSAEIERPLGAASDFPEVRVVSLKGERELQISTGWIERNARETLRYFDELLLSEELYLVNEKGHIPLQLVTNTLTDAEDAADLISRTFTFRQTTPVTNFSSLPAAPSKAARPTGWRGIGIVQTLDSLGKRTGRGRPLKLQKYYIDDNSLYKPRSEKPNTQGDPDYIPDLYIPGSVPGSTPYPNQAISRDTQFTRQTCGADQIGAAVTISIAGGKYGGEQEGDADALAEAEFKGKNTQAYANEAGACLSSPELYTVAIPAGLWHYRAADRNRVAIYYNGANTGEPNIGNTWDLQGENRPYCFAQNTNDLDFPPKSANWLFLAYGPAGASGRVMVWRNGGLMQNQIIGFNSDGFENVGLLFGPVAGDKIYIKVTTL